MTTSFLLCVASGLLSIFLGWLIWQKGWHHFAANIHVAAYNAQPQKFARLIGQYAIFTGILTILLPFALETFGSYALISYAICAVTSLFYIFFKLQSLIQ